MDGGRVDHHRSLRRRFNQVVGRDVRVKERKHIMQVRKVNVGGVSD